MILQHGSASYRVGTLVAETDTYRVYICEGAEPGKQYLLQIATDTRHNGGLERAAYILRELKQTSDLFEAEYAKSGTGRLLSYDRLFPEVIDGFNAEDQAGRRINILAITEVNDITKLVPLSNLASKDRQRIALASSAWVMGRLLKLLGFAHGEGIAVRALAGSNVLLEPARHFVTVFDWSSSQTHQGKVPASARKDDMAAAAQAVFAAIGGNPETGEFNYDGECRYVEFLWRLASRQENDAERAHDQFYELVEELWGREFRKFQTLPL